MPDKRGVRNLRREDAPDIVWDSTSPIQSLEKLRRLVDLEGQKAIDWYWKATRWKRIPSQWIQFLALLLTAAAGLAPIVVQLIENLRRDIKFDSGPLASLCVGIAASLIGLDKAFGYSSGWTRCVLTATSMTKLLDEYRMDSIAFTAAASSPPSPGQQAAIIQRAKDFVSTMQGMVIQETREWATEFQSNLAQMEKDIAAQLNSLKAQVEKKAREDDLANRPGAIELTVTNANKTDGFTFEVVLEGSTHRSVDSVSNATVWTRINNRPGQYRVIVNAATNGKPVSTSAIVTISPWDTASASVILPID